MGRRPAKNDYESQKDVVDDDRVILKSSAAQPRGMTHKSTWNACVQRLDDILTPKPLESSAGDRAAPLAPG
jgi:hypothetical protein